jgi:hypothetical protein
MIVHHSMSGGLRASGRNALRQFGTVCHSPVRTSHPSATRLFTASLQKPIPRDEYFEYRPRQTGAQRYGGAEEPFDIRDLAFTPCAPVKTIPKRIPIRPRRNGRFAVPEQGDTDNRLQCRTCGRRFARDRIGKHESVCMGGTKRPTFDSREQRLAGTEAAQHFCGYSAHWRESTNFRDEHAQLMNALRAARKMEMRERPARFGA